eukprot:15935316-Heterocapsa_arctica.AAC.1
MARTAKVLQHSILAATTAAAAAGAAAAAASAADRAALEWVAASESAQTAAAEWGAAAADAARPRTTISSALDLDEEARVTKATAVAADAAEA